MIVVGQEGPIRTYRCENCGAEQQGAITPGPEELQRFLDESGIQHERQQVWVEWIGQEPSAKELVGLRQLVDSLRDIPLSELKAKVHQASRWDLGIHWDVAAQELEARGLELGLQIRRLRHESASSEP